MKTALRLLLWLSLGLFAAIGIATVVYLTRFNGEEVLARGIMETEVRNAFGFTQDITRVRVYRLGEMSKTGIPPADAFPILPYGSFARIESRIELVDTELETFLALWRKMSPGYDYQALCHEPVFAVELFSGNKRTFRTSLCWKCSNFYVELIPGVATWYGFRSNSPDAQAALKFFEEKLPRK